MYIKGRLFLNYKMDPLLVLNCLVLASLHVMKNTVAMQQQTSRGMEREGSGYGLLESVVTRLKTTETFSTDHTFPHQDFSVKFFNFYFGGKLWLVFKTWAFMTLPEVPCKHNDFIYVCALLSSCYMCSLYAVFFVLYRLIVNQD